MHRLFLVGLLLTPALAVADDGLVPSRTLTPRELGSWVRGHSVKASVAKLSVELAMAEARGARLFGNPLIDFTWGTIPVGPTNPANLSDPLNKIPNYAVGVSYVFDFLHRAPRVRRADAMLTATQADADAQLREETWTLGKAIGKMAVASLKRRASSEMLTDAQRAAEVARTRGKAGAGSLLDVDRMENERLRAELQVVQADADLEASRADCAAIVGTTCADFASADEAEAFLHAWTDLAMRADGDIEKRSDLRALKAAEIAAAEELAAAKLVGVPDVTVRLGYTRDQFTIAGNQMNSLSVSVSLPLPLLSNGQADRLAATARIRRTGEQHQRLLRQSLAQMPLLRRAVQLGQERGRRLEQEMIPRARSVLDSLRKASESRLLPITDVLQASNSLNTLLIDEAENEGATFEAALDLFAQFPIAFEDKP